MPAKKEKEIILDAEEKKEKTKKEKNTVKIITLFFIVLIIGAFVIALNNVGILKIPKLKEITNPKPKIELTYTQPTTEVKEGIYITDVSDIVEEVMPSIVAITSKTVISSGIFGPFYGGESVATGAGSGIIVSKTDDELLILTNNHVIEDAEELSVQFVNEKSVDAKVKGASPRRDVAVISVDLKNLDAATAESIKIATLGDSKELKVGNGIIAIGNALGYGQSVTTGVVSALDREVEVDDVKTKMIQIDAAINGGNSGGALLNSRGEVVGINSVKYSQQATSTQASVEGMGFAIPITDVKDIITSLMNGEDISNATMGVEGYMITEEQSEAYHMPVGFYISRIVEGSGADKANLEIGNIITKVEGKEVKEFSDITSVIYSKKKGDTLHITINYISGRSYKEKDVEVTLS